MAVIGIPRAFLYFSLGTLWTTFFEELGHEVLISPQTTKPLLDAGVKNTNDHCCLPVKTGFGHAAQLIGKVDFIFFPRIISIEKGCYICPKFMGLPDMLRASVPGLPPLIGGDAEGYSGGDGNFHALAGAGKVLGHTSPRIKQAYGRSNAAQLIKPAWCDALPEGILPHGSRSVGVLGHPYITYDPFLNMGILTRLARLGLSPITYEMLEETSIIQGLEGVSRHIFWTFGKRVVGAARFLADSGAVEGIIHMASFGCGPDSFTGTMISDYCQGKGLPFLELTLDEHTGEAGAETRVEAFADVVGMRCPA